MAPAEKNIGGAKCDVVIYDVTNQTVECDTDKPTVIAHEVGRVVGVLSSEAGFAGSMLYKVISMMHVLHYHKNSKLQLSGLK